MKSGKLLRYKRLALVVNFLSGLLLVPPVLGDSTAKTAVGSAIRGMHCARPCAPMPPCGPSGDY